MRRGALLFLALALGLPAAGCGGDNGTTSGTTSTSPATSTPSAGGEKSIEEFGREAASADRAALLGAFHGYLNALAGEDYSTACSYLAASVQTSLEEIVVKGLKAKGCAAILPKLLSPTAPAVANEQAAGKVTKVRVQGDRAFVVFHAPGAKLYQLPMAREGGEWKVGLVAASVLVPSAATLGQ